jgi:hypothetical protein
MVAFDQVSDTIWKLTKGSIKWFTPQQLIRSKTPTALTQGTIMGDLFFSGQMSF